MARKEFARYLSVCLTALVFCVSHAAAATLSVPSASYPTIQSALSAASSGDTVEVAPETTPYYENTLDFGGKDLTLVCTGAAGSCTLDGGSGASVLYLHGGQTNSSLISGFTIQNGSADYGGAIRLDNASPTITKCTITQNQANSDGGGISCTNSSSPLLQDCTISSNSAGYGGGGLYVDDSSSQPTLSRCSILSNRVSYGWAGGGIFTYGGGIFSNCLIAENTIAYGSGSGAGLYIDSSSTSLTVTNCTITSNDAGSGGSGAGVYGSSSNFSIANSIIWSNSPDNLAVYGAPSITYSDIQDGYAGAGNIASDPLFVDPANGNFRLQTGSPCIDSGNNSASGVGSLDLDGKARISNLTVDMGAYEQQASLSVTSVSPAGNTIGNGVGTTITATFNNPMSAGSINSSSFQVSGGVTGSLSYHSSNRTATFIPAAPLAYGTTYTVTIKGGTGGVSDLAGSTLASDYTWSFKTEVTAPTVTTASISNRTSTKATGGGTVTSAGGGTVSARGVCWNTAGSPSNSDTSSTCTNDGTGTGTFTSTLIPLAPATTYHVRAYATNEAGTAYDTTDVVFTTPLSSYSLSTQASPSAAGSIGLSPAGGVYDSGTPVQLTATPASGYAFSQWSGDLSGSANPAGLTMNGNKSVTAIFVPAIYTLTVVKQGTGSGSVTPDSGSLSWSGSTGTGSYALNTTVTLTASADTGSSFGGWSGCDSTNGNACTVLMSNARSVSATFPVSYTISGTIKDGNFPVSGVTVTLSGNGSNTTLTTGATGTYSFSEPNGTYVITPSRSLSTFTPQSRTVTVNGSNKTGQDFSASTLSSSVTIKLPGAATADQAVKAYRMISIPVMPSSSDVFETLSPYWGGAYDPRLWRLYGPNETEITAQGDDAIDYGKGWWIISTAPKTIVISGTPLAGDYECQIAPGYQMIGSPYPNVNVSWSSVLSDPFNSSLRLGASVYSWDGSGEFVTVTRLEPGKAYWVWSQSTGTMRMLESYGPSTAGRSGSKRSGALTQQVRAKRIWLNQPPPPLSPAASIEVKSPKQGTVLRAGSQCLISWKAVGVSPQGFSSKVEISYSVDGGKSYSLISSKNSSGGSLRWKVPNAPSGQCVVKVTSSLYPNVSASSGVLTISK